MKGSDNMPRRKKHPKLPNGYGSIKYLGKGRRNPYAVHPPVTEFTLDGVPVTPKAICYCKDWYTGFAVLTAWKAGTYEPGMERDVDFSGMKPQDAVARMLSDYSQHTRIEKAQEKGPTFTEVFELYFADKYINTKKEFSKQALNSTKAAFKNCKRLHDKEFRSLTLDDLQKNLDACPLKHSSLELIKSLYRGMYRYALPHGITETDYSTYVTINIPDDDEHGVPFSGNDLEKLWKHKEDPVAAMILIMCYSGYRIAAYSGLKVDLKKKYFQGGVKTAAGKNRVVPIHGAILPLVQTRLKAFGALMKESPQLFRESMYETLLRLGIEKHTPHDCRHTFSMLCDKYGVDNIAKKKLLGHSFGADLSNGTYGHWDLNMLREEIEKIKAPV